MANSVDPDQTQHFVTPDAGFHCSGLSFRILGVITVTLPTEGLADPSLQPLQIQIQT